MLVKSLAEKDLYPSQNAVAIPYTKLHYLVNNITIIIYKFVNTILELITMRFGIYG